MPLMGICGFSIDVKLDFPVRKCACGIQTRIPGGRNVHSELDGTVERVCHIDEIMWLSRPLIHFISMSSMTSSKLRGLVGE
jgi:hypothetical protein